MDVLAVWCATNDSMSYHHVRLGHLNLCLVKESLYSYCLLDKTFGDKISLDKTYETRLQLVRKQAALVGH